MQPARLFVNRILQLLRNTPAKGKISLDASFYKDIHWFCNFLQEYNSITKIHRSDTPCVDMYMDACLTGIGAYVQQQVYWQEIPYFYRIALNVVHFKMMNVMTALRVWGSGWQNKIRIHCGNTAVVEVLNRGMSRDPFLCTFARTIWLLKAKYNLQLSVVHIRGIDNVYAKFSDYLAFVTYRQSLCSSNI